MCCTLLALEHSTRQDWIRQNEYMNRRPAFSVIMPCYNRPDELRWAIRSILDQTLPDFELIVVDDASANDVEQAIRSFTDQRLRHIRNSVRLGAAGSRNRGIAAATGEYVSFLDADDMYLPHRLDRLADTIDALGQPDVVCHRQFRLRESRTGVSTYEVIPARAPAAGEHLSDYLFREGNWLQINCVTVKAAAAHTLDFDTSMTLWEDTKYVLELWNAGYRFAFSNDVLSVYFDEMRTSRASLQQSELLHAKIYEYLKSHCTPTSVRAFEATALSNAIFFSHPLKALRYLVSGYRAGVPARRCLYQLARGMLGQRNMKALLSAAAARAPGSRAIPPELADLLATQVRPDENETKTGTNG